MEGDYISKVVRVKAVQASASLELRTGHAGGTVSTANYVSVFVRVKSCAGRSPVRGAYPVRSWSGWAIDYIRSTVRVGGCASGCAVGCAYLVRGLRSGLQIM